MEGLLPSVVALGPIAAAALAATLSRPRLHPDPRRTAAAARWSALTVALQAAHFLEEQAGGLHRALPELFGLAPMPEAFFVTFNLAWLALWAAGAAALARRRRWPLFPLWFLALAATANGLLHPLLAAASGGRVPGVVTALPVAAAGAWLARRLWLATDASPAPSA